MNMIKSFVASAAISVLAASAGHAAGPGFLSDGAVNICTTANFPPMTFKKNVEDSLPSGIDIEISERLAKEWGVKTAYTVTNFDGLLPTLGAGRCGLIISGIYVNDERRKSYNAVRYMKSATVLVTKADNTEITAPEALSDKTVALESGSYYKAERVDPLNKQFAAAGKPVISVQDYPAQQAAYQQVLVGRADATLTEEAEGAYRVASAPGQLKLAYTWKSESTFGIYMRKNPDDMAAVRSTLEKLHKDGFFAELAKKYGLDASVFDVDYGS
jgi:polar amino acid transport system substrate-binding protein